MSNRLIRRSGCSSSWDYYFITIDTYRQARIFGEILDDVMIINDLGLIVCYEWYHSALHREAIALDEFIVMPDQIHGILRTAKQEGGPTGAASPSLAAFVRAFKSAVTKQVNLARGTPGAPVWQGIYRERAISGKDEYEAMRQYIIENPIHWGRKDPCTLESSAGDCSSFRVPRSTL